MKRKLTVTIVVLAMCLLAACPKGGTERSGKPEVGVEHYPDGTRGGPMLYVPRGSFMMGCDVSVDNRCLKDGLPYHSVRIDAFYIDKFEVTVEQFSECVTAGTCSRPRDASQRRNCNWGQAGRDSHPVNCINWYQADEYCKWAGKRLPTEAEWEKAARGTDGGMYPWGNQLATCEFAVMDDRGDGCGEGTTLPVGSRPRGASPYGAMDMSGNVWEWTADWYDESYYESAPGRNPKGPQSGKDKILRGGAYNDNPLGLRATTRSWEEPEDVGSDDGFRCVKN